MFGLAPPDVPEDGAALWAWFWELASGRGSNGFGPQPISWGDMVAWATTYCIDLQPWQATILRAMDGAWLASTSEKHKAEQ